MFFSSPPPFPLVLTRSLVRRLGLVLLTTAGLATLTACSQGISPQVRNINIPAPQGAEARPEGVNERPDSVIYLPLGRDILVPEVRDVDALPDKQVGPFELRGETLGGALQLILADVDIPIAFQTDLGLSRTVTVTNLKGDLSDVVDQVCSLADLYCSFERGALVVKQSQTFTVVIPPIGTTENRTAMLTGIASAIQSITGSTPISDPSTRTIIYQATSRTADQVNRYFQRMRAMTSMIIYETYIWEVALDNTNAAGIQWSLLDSKNEFNFGVSVSGVIDPDVGTPISIGLPTTGAVNFTTGDILKFISNYGAVKTISQPQLTVLSGSTARLRVADTQNYVSEITRTVSGDQTTVSNETDSVESGFTLEIGSSWDNATVYGNINVILNEVREIQTFDNNPEAIVQLPQTTAREVQTQVRVRPGDSLLIAGLVRESDILSKTGLGVDKPIIPTSRSTTVSNVELVFLLRPRVVVFVDSDARHTRAPIDADAPQDPVVLPHGHQQTRLPITDPALMDAQGLPETTLPVAPVAITPPPASASVVDRLFDTAVPMTAASVPPVDPVAAAPLPAPEQALAAPPAQQTKKKKSAPKRQRPKPSNVTDQMNVTEAPMVRSAADVADKVLNAPDSSAQAFIPNDLPPLTDGTILPPVSAPSTPAASVTP